MWDSGLKLYRPAAPMFLGTNNLEIVNDRSCGGGRSQGGKICNRALGGTGLGFEDEGSTG